MDEPTKQSSDDAAVDTAFDALESAQAEIEATLDTTPPEATPTEPAAATVAVPAEEPTATDQTETPAEPEQPVEAPEEATESSTTKESEESQSTTEAETESSSSSDESKDIFEGSVSEAESTMTDADIEALSLTPEPVPETPPEETPDPVAELAAVESKPLLPEEPVQGTAEEVASDISIGAPSSASEELLSETNATEQAVSPPPEPVDPVKSVASNVVPEQQVVATAPGPEAVPDMAVKIPDVLTHEAIDTSAVIQPDELPVNSEPVIKKDANPAPTPNQIPGVTAPVEEAHHSKDFSGHFKKKGLLIGLAAVAIITLLAVVAAFVISGLGNKSLSAEDAFKEFPVKALQTSSVKQVFTADAEVAQFEGEGVFDFSNPQKVQSDLSVRTAIDFLVTLNYDQSIITTEEAQYLRINAYDLGGDIDGFSVSQQSELNRIKNLEDSWVQIQGDGTSEQVQQTVGELGDIIDGFNSVLGEVVVASLTDNQLSAAKDFLAEKPVYSFSGEPTEASVGGVEAYRYDVSINSDQLEDYNDTIADLMTVAKLEQGAIPDSYSNVAIWLSKEDASILQLEFEFDDADITYKASIVYSSHNDQVSVTAPSSVLSTQEAIDVLNGIVAADEIEEVEELEDESEALEEEAEEPEVLVEPDTQRKTDINAIHANLEALFVEVGFYPTVAQLFDDAWVATNLPGLDESATSDPSSGKYTYVTTTPSCDNVTIDCTTYILSADLEEDGRGAEDADNNNADYVKNSLN